MIEYITDDNQYRLSISKDISIESINIKIRDKVTNILLRELNIFIEDMISMLELFDIIDNEVIEELEYPVIFVDHNIKKFKISILKLDYYNFKDYISMIIYIENKDNVYKRDIYINFMNYDSYDRFKDLIYRIIEY